jgi:hypothetical protein
MSTENIFVYLVKNIPVGANETIYKNEVGIISPGNKSVFFVRIWENVNLSVKDYKKFDVKKTGDNYSKKICNICHKLISTELFDRNQNNINRSVRRPSCQQCRQEIDGKSPNSQEIRQWLKNNPKPNQEPFECPICGKRTIAGVTSKVDLHHDHRTGKVRGWICDSCNTGIGRFKDDTAVLKKAIQYVQ